MKYRVTTKILEAFEFGETLTEYDNDGWFYNADGSEGLKEEIIERNPDWFEPVEEVKEGQYWELRGDIIRVNRVYGRASCRAIDGKVIDISEKSYDWTTGKFTDEGRKLSTHEIEQALIKEAKRRGFDNLHTKYKCAKDERQCTIGKINPDYIIKYYDINHHNDNDCLTDGNGGYIYYQGTWASIIEDEWEVTPNGYYVTNGDNKYIGIRNDECPAFDGLTKEQAKVIANALNEKE